MCQTKPVRRRNKCHERGWIKSCGSLQEDKIASDWWIRESFLQKVALEEKFEDETFRQRRRLRGHFRMRSKN